MKDSDFLLNQYSRVLNYISTLISNQETILLFDFMLLIILTCFILHLFTSLLQQGIFGGVTVSKLD